MLAAVAPFVPASAASEVGRYVVLLERDRNPERSAVEHGKKYGAKAKHFYRSAIKGYSAAIPRSRVADLRADPSVVSVTENYTFRAAAQTIPFGVDRVQADIVPGTGEGVQVAILDSGIDYTHPDLQGNVLGGVDCEGSNTGNYLDEQGHGTHVAGILAAVDNTIGVVGVAPKAKLWAVRILDELGQGFLEDIMCGLDWVDARTPANGGSIRIANMSLEAFILNADDGDCGFTDGDTVHQAICSIVEGGTTVVAAAGNNQNNIKDVPPAAYDEVIAVTALVDYDGDPCGLASAPPGLEADDTFAEFSSFATTANDLAHTLGAPGAYEIVSTVPGGGYDENAGTSMAAPHVAGAAARYLQTHPGAAPSEVLNALRTNAEPKNVDFQNDCPGTGSSHTDPSTLHPEPVVRVIDWEIDPEVTTPGIVRGTKWFLTNGFDANADVVFNYGTSTDKIVVGDWNGDGIDSPGIVRGNTWYLNNGLDPNADVVFNYGSSTDRPIVGDWDGDGEDEPGIVRGNTWFLNDELDPNADHVFQYGSSTDKIVAGDWNDDGTDSPGIVRGNQWFVNNGFDPNADDVFFFGATTDVPIVGDWFGDGQDRPGIHRSNKWFLNLGFDQSAEIVFPYGLPSDRFVVGDWDSLGNP
jgi:subtilisin